MLDLLYCGAHAVLICFPLSCWHSPTPHRKSPSRSHNACICSCCVGLRLQSQRLASLHPSLVWGQGGPFPKVSPPTAGWGGGKTLSLPHASHRRKLIFLSSALNRVSAVKVVPLELEGQLDPTK